MKNDSTHEDYFEWWAKEAINAGLIKKIERCESFEITPKQEVPFVKVGKVKETLGKKLLLNSLNYTPDYCIYWNNYNHLNRDLYTGRTDSTQYFVSKFHAQKEIRQLVSFIDIKPDMFSRAASPSAITFPIHQKLMYELYGLYVQKVVLYPASNTKNKNKTLFTDTWCPQQYIDVAIYKRDCAGGKVGDSKIKWPYRTLGQWELEFGF